MLKIALIDNRDSFSYSIVDYFLQLGTEVRLIHLDESDKYQNCIKEADGIVLGPGPGNPAELPMLQKILASYLNEKPILGICLGFQAICYHFGATLVKGHPVHGKISQVIQTNDNQLFKSLSEKFQVVRYHSLTVENIKKPLVQTLITIDGVAMAVQHESLPISGVQFHPEAHLSDFGLQILNNWLNIW